MKNNPRLEEIVVSKLKLLEREHWRPVRELFSSLPSVEEIVAHYGPLSINCAEESVSVSAEKELTDSDREKFVSLVRALMPWRKGPFSLFGVEIDAEWRSNLKWDRIAPHLGFLDGKRVLDVGCNNGYYLFRLEALAQSRDERPKELVGIDPSENFYFQFQLFKKYLSTRVDYELLGIEHLEFISEAFDLILCLGVIYHQREPVLALRNLRNALAPGGRLILESQVIPGEGSEALRPEGRYLKARNVYFVPTVNVLLSWLEEAGFSDCRILSLSETSFNEQRRTQLMQYESLEDFLDPNDRTKTIEGHPVPMRAICMAKK